MGIGVGVPIVVTAIFIFLYLGYRFGKRRGGNMRVDLLGEERGTSHLYYQSMAELSGEREHGPNYTPIAEAAVEPSEMES